MSEGELKVRNGKNNIIIVSSKKRRIKNRIV